MNEEATGLKKPILRCHELRHLLFAKAYLLERGYRPDDRVITVLNRERDHYIERWGMATYLSQMLGDFSTLPIRICILKWETGETKDDFDGAQQQAQHYINQRYAGRLPCAVEFYLADGITETRYL
jgi:hypothetical protein